jgi:hypothetical protein
MFGFGNRNRQTTGRNTGVFSNTRLRNAALAGLGMMAFRWWRNRNAGGSGARNPAM